MADSLYDKGLKVRRSVLGDDYVDQALARVTDFDRAFQELITETAWGSVWSRPGLGQGTRSLLTLCILASLGHWNEFRLHIRATRNTGASLDEIREALIHVAIYAGVPAANRAIAIVKEEIANNAFGSEGETP